MLELYRSQIIDRAQHPHFAETLEHSTHRAEGANPSCGDEIQWEIEVNKGKILHIAHHCRACAICTASADLLAEYLHNRSLDSVEKISKENVTAWLGIELSPARLKCALLPLETLRLNLEETKV